MMISKKFTARITRRYPFEVVKSNVVAQKLYNESVDFAEDIYRLLPGGQYVIEIINGRLIWVFETRLKMIWRDGVPMRRF